MKLLLDENLPVKLKQYFSEVHQIHSVKDQGWSGKKNGELMKLMKSNDFDALITIDKNLKHQQNLDKHMVFIVVLDAPNNKIPTLTPLIEKLEMALSKPLTGFVMEIN